MYTIEDLFDKRSIVLLYPWEETTEVVMLRMPISSKTTVDEVKVEETTTEEVVEETPVEELIEETPIVEEMKEEVIKNSWLPIEDFINFIAVSCI